MTREDLVRLVKVKLEEVSPFEPDEGNLIASTFIPEADVKAVTAYIEKTLDDACNDVLMIIPLVLIRTKHIPQTETMSGTNYLLLPEDYLRLAGLKMAGWEREIVTPITTANPIYKLQGNPHTCGKYSKPVVVYNEDEICGRVLEVYPDGAVTSNFHYVARFDDREIQEDLADFYALMTAIKVYEYYGLADKAKLLMGEFENKVKSAMLSAR